MEKLILRFSKPPKQNFFLFALLETFNINLIKEVVIKFLYLEMEEVL
ncbi:MAG: hypothetical protein RMJ67_09100 [Elusimicrobiota bacterium]|nr:hypothetical protein [Endomicrobiia bacterium]MDW8166653.1 hypothetical protein [Elusimicrobiota bacterium]